MWISKIRKVGKGMNLTIKEKASYGLGAVGKDMAYMLSASYVLYYYQDVMGVDAMAMGVLLLVARIFDALNDPIMGVIVAKTKTRWGRFRPWLLIGTVTDAVVLYFLFSAPPSLDGQGLFVYACVFYLLWCVTYTMMDIPYWSMIPALTKGGKDREELSTIARTCAGIGGAIITVSTMLLVPKLGNGDERIGFSRFALIVAVIFVITILITCINVKEDSTVDVETSSVRDMFKALIKNDQAMTVVVVIVLINTALYITSNLLIYFFKYDVGGANWNENYTIFTAFGGAIQILSMMVLYPFLRKFISSMKVFYLSFAMAIGGFALLLNIMFTGYSSFYVLFIPGFFIFAAFGMLTVLTTVFLADTVDYGEVKNNQRDESVIFSMQTFVVQLASGLAVFIASIVLTVFNISDEIQVTGLSTYSATGLRTTMTMIPIVGLLLAVFVFYKKYILTDKKMSEITKELEVRNE